MASTSNSTADLSAIPSSVSGDGTTFVKGLKRYLRGYSNTVEDLIDNSGVGQVTNIVMTEQHVTVSGVSQNNIYITFDTGSVSNYAFAQIWITQNIKGAWTQDGITNNSTYTIENVTAGNTYYVKVIGSNKEAYSDFDRATISSITIDGSSKICNVPTQFYWDNASKRWIWSGYTDNGYTDFFELRTDKNAGTAEGRLDRIDFTLGQYYSTAEPTARSGTAYLFVRNIYGDYNSPVSHVYAINGLAKPNAPTISGTVDGVVIVMDDLPSGATNYIVDVDGEEFEVYTSQWTYYQTSGTINVKYCFVDNVGKGEWSNSVSSDVGRLIVAGDISDNAITAAKIATNAVEADKIKAGAITAVKIDTDAVTADKIKAGAITTAKLDALAVTADKIAANTITSAQINTSTLTVGGTNGNITLNDGCVTTVKLDANAVTADKIAVGAITAAKIDITNGSTSARITFDNNLICVYDSAGTLRVRLGVWDDE